MPVYDPAINSTTKLRTEYNKSVNNDNPIGIHKEDDSLFFVEKLGDEYGFIDKLYSLLSIEDINLTQEDISSLFNATYQQQETIISEALSNVLDRVISLNTQQLHKFDETNILPTTKPFRAYDIIKGQHILISTEITSAFNKEEMQSFGGPEAKPIKAYDIVKRNHILVDIETPIEISKEDISSLFSATYQQQETIIGKALSNVLDRVISLNTQQLHKFDETNILPTTKPTKEYDIIKGQYVSMNIKETPVSFNKEEMQSFTGTESIDISYEENIEKQHIPENIKKTPISGRRIGL